jgi:hypothetical protein
LIVRRAERVVEKSEIVPVILLLIAVAVANLIFLVWFIVSINRIKEELRQIAANTRRTALALPLTTGQAKLINRSFTAAELVSLIEKQGGKPRVERQERFGGADQEGGYGGVGFEVVVIQNRGALDPELVTLAASCEKEIIAILKAREDHA